MTQERKNQNFELKKFNPHDENDPRYVGKVHPDEPDEKERRSGVSREVGSPSAANAEVADAVYGH